MESKCISIEQKVPGLCYESQYIIDFLNASLTVEVKSFAEINIICNRYLCGNPDKWNAIYISGEIIKTYNNMFEDGTWNHEIGKRDQIIRLSTKVAKLQSKLEKTSHCFSSSSKIWRQNSSHYIWSWRSFALEQARSIHCCTLAINKERGHRCYEWKGLSLVYWGSL